MIVEEFKKWQILKNVHNKENISFLIDLFSVTIYINKNINSWALLRLKKIINNYISTRYNYLQNKDKDYLIEYCYSNILKEIEIFKKNDKIFHNKKEKVFNLFLESLEKNYLFLLIKKLLEENNNNNTKNNNIFNYEKKTFLGMYKEGIKKTKF